MNVEKFLTDFQDFMAPTLDVYEQSIYIYIVRHSRLIGQNDVVIGSRFIAGGKDLDRSYLRKSITFLARNFVRHWLGIEVHDISSGYRCFRRQALEKLELAWLKSKGPSLVIEILYKAYFCGLKIKEVPITFIQRKKGKSKLNITSFTNWAI